MEKVRSHIRNEDDAQKRSYVVRMRRLGKWRVGLDWAA